jgi:2-iminobutanoate/2-iminopropanoate deaminase
MNKSSDLPAVTCLNSPKLFGPGGHYSHVCIVNDIAHISGQLPIDRDGKLIADPTFERQVHQVLENLDCCLETAGTDRTCLVQVRVYIRDMADWGKFDQLYRSWLGECRPARAVAGVSSLHYDAALEIEAMAWVKGAPAI